MKTFLVFFALLHLKFTNACKCAAVDTSKPAFLCQKEYVLRGKVSNETVIGNISMPEKRYRVYTVKVQQIYMYRGLDRFSNNASVVNIQTPEQGAACGVVVPLNKDLVMSGTFQGMNISLRRCSGWFKEFKDLNDEFRTALSDMEAFCSSSPSTAFTTTAFITTVFTTSSAAALSLQALMCLLISFIFV